jgi:hypothetical protein
MVLASGECLVKGSDDEPSSPPRLSQGELDLASCPVDPFPYAIGVEIFRDRAATGNVAAVNRFEAFGAQVRERTLPSALRPDSVVANERR